MSDLHLEFKQMRDPLPEGDVLVLAGDITNLACLAPGQDDPKRVRIRDRSLAFFEEASAKFRHVLYISGNHEPYNFDIEKSAETVTKHLHGIIYLDDEAIEIDGVHFVCSTLWSDLGGNDPSIHAAIAERINDFKCVKVGNTALSIAAAREKFCRSKSFVEETAARLSGKPVVVVTHHAPSLLGLNDRDKGNGLDGAFASDLHELIESHPNISNWIFGHTHVRKTFQVGDTICRANCRGYDTVPWSNANEANGFQPDLWFDV